MRKSAGITVTMVLLALAWQASAAEAVAKISLIEGKASVLGVGADKWRPARPNMTLKVGDELFTREESFVEVRYHTGAILRMDESSKIVIEKADANASSTRTGVGNVWVNMKKLVGTGKEFELKTPTATAAIRGTVFNATTHKDSSTDVAVYSGKVDVGASDDVQKSMKKAAPPTPSGPTEVPGPEEIPGPYEVSLDQWKSIVAGQMISVRKDGKFAQETFDPEEKAQQDDFAKRNMERDKQLAGEE